MTPKNRHANAILFVNDDIMATKWLEKTFAQDYTIQCANSAANALSMMELYGDKIAVVVADFRIPECDGLELFKLLSELYPWIVKIIVTAHADKDLVIKAVNEHLVFRVLEKPWDDNVVRRALRAAQTMFQQTLSSRDHIENSILGMHDSLTFMAEEFRAPLNVISSCLQIIQNTLNDLKASNKLPSQLSDIRPALRGAQRSLSASQMTINNFVHATHTVFAASKTNPIQASQLIQLLLNEMPLTDLQRTWFYVDSKEDFLFFEKQNLVYLCLTHLLQNALNALADHAGQPSINIRIIDEAARSKDASGYSIRLSDNGKGIPNDAMRAMQVSSQTIDAEPSHAMGLVFCKKLMQSIGGSMDINSSAEGTSVTLNFPSASKG